MVDIAVQTRLHGHVCFRSKLGLACLDLKLTCFKICDCFSEVRTEKKIYILHLAKFIKFGFSNKNIYGCHNHKSYTAFLKTKCLKILMLYVVKLCRLQIFNRLRHKIQLC